MNTDSKATRIIISDLHLGADDEFDIFTAPEKEALFESFVDYCTRAAATVELIINGDFVDLLQLRPWDTRFDRATAMEKARQIAAAHKSVFDALGRFLPFVQ